MFKSKGQKSADRFVTDYFKTFHNTYQSLVAQKGLVNRAELERVHDVAAKRAYKNLTDRGHQLLGVDALAAECFPLAVQQVGWEEPKVAPAPKANEQELTAAQERSYRDMYDAVFDQWMARRIEQGADSPEDFARADFFAYTKAEDVLTELGIQISENERQRLCDEQYQQCVERAGYREILGTPLPKLSTRE